MDTETHWVYMLLSERDGKLYTGVTSDLERRIRAHAAGKVRSTKHRRPLVLIHTEEFPGKAAAMDRERFLKTPAAGSIKSGLLRHYLQGQSSAMD
jgi:putative endonuclease